MTDDVRLPPERDGDARPGGHLARTSSGREVVGQEGRGGNGFVLAGGGEVPHGSHGSGPNDDTIELAEVLGILRRNAWLVTICVVLGGVLAWFASEHRTPEYRATAVIRVEDPGQQLSGQLAMLDRGAGRTDPLLSAVEILRSQSVLGSIVEREGLRIVPLDDEAPRLRIREEGIDPLMPPDTLALTLTGSEVSARLLSGSQGRAPYGAPLTVGDMTLVVEGRPEAMDAAGNDELRFAVLSRGEAVRWVEERLSARRRPDTNVVDVEFMDTDPVRVQRVVNQAVTVFRERSMEEARGTSVRRRVFLEVQLAQADTLLYESQDALSRFRTQNQVFSSGQRAVAQESGLMEVEMRREELRADRQSFAQLLGTFEASQGTDDAANRLQVLAASPQVAGNPIVAALFEDLLRYESERAALTSGPWGLTERNPDVARLDQQIATTSGRLRDAITSQLDVIDARLAALDDLRGRTAGQIAGIPQTEAEEARLLQQVGAAQRTVEQLREEYYRAQMAEAVEEGPVEIVDLALAPVPVSGAGLPVMLALGMMLGFMVGGGAAFLKEMLNTSVRRRDDLESTIRAPMVGVIPRIAGLNGHRKGRSAPRGGDRRSGGRELVTVNMSKTPQAEAFRTLRTNLLFAQDFDPVRLLVVTSAVPGEGKTTTAANLAVAYAQQGLRVLLVDCDLRRPRLDEIFQVERKPGLTELALGQVGGKEAIRRYEPVENLWLLPSGALPDAPSELVGGKRMRQLMDLLKDRFDAVILDTPPLAGGADAAILGAQADGVLMVVRAASTDREAVEAASRQLHSVGARLLGAVMNDPSGEVPRYGYAYEYGYYGGTE